MSEGVTVYEVKETPHGFQAKEWGTDGRFTREVAVDRTLNPMQSIEATRRKPYVTPEIVAEMPIDGPEKVTLHFFNLDYKPSSEDIERELERRGLKTDPQALVALNAQDSTFADEYPNQTQWLNEKGEACFLGFARWEGTRLVGCGLVEGRAETYWWHAGVPK